MDDPHPVFDVRVVDAHVVRVVDHQRRRAVRDRSPQGLDRRVAVLLQHQGHDLEAGRRRRGGVAGVGLDGGDDLVACPELALGGEPGARDAGMRVGRVSPAAGLEHELVHAGQLAQDQVEAVQDLQRPLQRLLVLKRVNLRDFRAPRRGLRDGGVVLHRAGAEEADVLHPQGHLGEVQVVAQHLGLGKLGEPWPVAATHGGGDERRGVADGPGDLGICRRVHLPAPAGMTELHDERLVPAGGVIVAQLDRGGGVSAGVVHEDRTLFKARTRCSMSSWEWISVTQ